MKDVEQPPSRIEVDKDIEVGGCMGIAPSMGTEYPDISRSMEAG